MKLVELFAVPDTVVTALGRVDILHGGWVRFVWYVEHQNPDGSSDNVIVASIVMAAEMVPQNRQITDEALNAAREEPVTTAAPANFH